MTGSGKITAWSEPKDEGVVTLDGSESLVLFRKGVCLPGVVALLNSGQWNGAQVDCRFDRSVANHNLFIADCVKLPTEAGCS